MAEVALTTVINKTMEIGAGLIVEAGSRLYWLSENIKWIERQMRHFNSCLKDAEAKENLNNEVTNLIIDMRDLALDIEDLLDTYLPKIESRKKKGSFRFVKNVTCMPCYGATAHAFALEIEKIKKRVEEIEGKRVTHGINLDADIGQSNPTRNAQDDVIRNRRKMFLVEKESIFVGRDTTLRELEKDVLGDNSKCKKVCIIGEGGVGKTTIVKKLFEGVQKEFECSAMVYVSMKPNLSELFLQIAEKVGLEEERRKVNLETNLQSFLEPKKCLIYLDDIWDTQTWNDLKGVLPIDSQNGSRIIISSRHVDVGRYIGGESSLKRLEPLSEGKSWELFTSLLKKEETFDIKELEEIGRNIVKKCDGLPLLISVAVGMLRKRRRSRAAWSEVLENMSNSAENDSLNILSLSYKDLPINLRPLFLYFGLFPEDKEILATELVGAWNTEKLIQLDGTKIPEYVVADQLEKLYDRNLIQVSSRALDDRIRSFRIHDVLRNLCIEIAKKINFFSTFQDIDSNSALSLRRLIILDGSVPTRDFPLNFRAPKLRSIVYFSPKEDNGRSLLLEKIGNFNSLTYLKLVGVFSSIPSSIWNLKSLQTFDARFATILNGCSIPTSVFKMRSLKHLIIQEDTKWPRMGSTHCLYTGSKNEVFLPNLETLYWVSCDYVEVSILSTLSELRKLKLMNVGEEHFELISSTTPVFNKLQELELWHIFVGDVLNLSSYLHLIKLALSLTDNFNRRSFSIKFPPNLIELRIVCITIDDDPMKGLKELLKLEILEMRSCRSTHKKWDCSGEDSFPMLQSLEIDSCEFEELIVDDQGMPTLRKFVYKPRWSLSHLEIPERIQNVMVEQSKGN